MTLNNLVDEAHDYAVEKGFWDETTATASTVALSKLALIHSEVSEALEEVRKPRPDLFLVRDGKPEGVLVELADVVIRVADMVGYYNDLHSPLAFDFDAIVKAKMEFNATRPMKHGKVL